MRCYLRLFPAVLLPLASIAACGDDDAGPAAPQGDGGLSFPDGNGVPASDAAPSDAGGGTDADASDTADAGDAGSAHVDYYIDPSAGADTNDGKTAGAAFKTLCKAKDAATANQVIGLADGNYGDAQRPPGWNLSIPCGPSFKVPVKIVALNPAKAVVQIPITLEQGGEIQGVVIDDEKLDGGGTSKGKLHVSGGTAVLRGVSFADVFSSPTAKAAPLVVDGTAKVTMFPDGVANYTTVPVPDARGLTFAFVNGNGELTLEGGTIDDSTAENADTYCNPAFEGSGKITLKNVTVKHKGGIVRAVTSGSFHATGGSLTDQSKANNVGCHPAIDLDGPGDVTLEDTTVGGSALTGVGSAMTAQGNLTITRTTVSGFSTAGIDLKNLAASTLVFSLRESKIQNNGVGLRIGAGVQADLGTTASPGKNTITDNATRGLESTATAPVQAAGNTWIASQQGAAADGTYAASLQTGPASGVNYALTSAANSIQF